MTEDEKERLAAIKRHPAGKKIERFKLYSITTYKCCDHCGVNYFEDSECAMRPHGHAVPCNEDGCITGRQISD